MEFTGFNRLIYVPKVRKKFLFWGVGPCDIIWNEAKIEWSNKLQLHLKIERKRSSLNPCAVRTPIKTSSFELSPSVLRSRVCKMSQYLILKKCSW